jgi:hypothetical protein
MILPVLRHTLLIDRLKGLPAITQGIMKTRIYKRVISLGKQGGLPATKDASVQNIPILLLILGHMITATAQGRPSGAFALYQGDLSLSYAQAGAIIFVFNLTSSIIQPLFGWLADRLSALWAGAAGHLRFRPGHGPDRPGPQLLPVAARGCSSRDWGWLRFIPRVTAVF